MNQNLERKIRKLRNKECLDCGLKAMHLLVSGSKKKARTQFEKYFFPVLMCENGHINRDSSKCFTTSGKLKEFDWDAWDREREERRGKGF